MATSDERPKREDPTPREERRYRLKVVAVSVFFEVCGLVALEVAPSHSYGGIALFALGCLLHFSPLMVGSQLFAQEYDRFDRVREVPHLTARVEALAPRLGLPPVVVVREPKDGGGKRIARWSGRQILVDEQAEASYSASELDFLLAIALQSPSPWQQFLRVAPISLAVGMACMSALKVWGARGAFAVLGIALIVLWAGLRAFEKRRQGRYDRRALECLRSLSSARSAIEQCGPTTKGTIRAQALERYAKEIGVAS